MNIAMDEIKQMKKQLKDAGAVEDFNQRQAELRRGLNTAEDKLSQKAPQETERRFLPVRLGRGIPWSS